MTQMAQENADRREFFRINDRLILNYKVITSSEARELGEMILSNAAPTAHATTQQMSSLHATFQHLLDQISHRDRDTARALRMLDEKLNGLTHTLHTAQNPIDDAHAEKVNLSAGGLAFMSDVDIEAKTPLEITLQLLPSGVSLHAISKVISCSHLGSDNGKTPYLLRLVFTHMSETDRNLLVKHTLTRQAESLRSHKHSDR